MVKNDLLCGWKHDVTIATDVDGHAAFTAAQEVAIIAIV
jgi:hypothetical protein